MENRKINRSFNRYPRLTKEQKERIRLDNFLDHFEDTRPQRLNDEGIKMRANKRRRNG